MSTSERDGMEYALRVVRHELDRWRIWPAAVCALRDVEKRITAELNYYNSSKGSDGEAAR